MSENQDSSASCSSSVNVQQLKSQLANRLQSQRPLVLKLHSILTWEQDVYPILIGAFVSVAFLTVYLMNSSILTTFSYLGIATALLDMALPMLTKDLASSGGKTNDKDAQKFDKICLDLARVYALMRTVCDSCCDLKTKKPKVYYPSLLTALLFMAYLGNKFNNLFLTYLFVLAVAMYPGLDKRGVPQRAVEVVFGYLGRRPPACLVSSSSSASSSGDRRSSGKRN